MHDVTQPTDLRSTVNATPRARRRRQQALTLACAALAIVLSACVSTDRTTAPVDVAARVNNSSPAALVQAFVNAQGTFCNPAGGIPCDGFTLFDIGYVYGACSQACNTSIVMDFGGVNRRWWDARNLGAYPAYSSTGTVAETMLQDGRRHLIVNIRAKNTFVVFLDANFVSIVGADFLEYPTVASPSSAPIVGEVTLHADLVLPVGYVGYPDIIEAAFDATSGIEVRAINTTATVDGPLRVPYDGVPAGTMVRVHGVSRSLLKLQTRGVPSKRLIALDYDPVSRIDVRVLR